jgi:hypothetical protein
VILNGGSTARLFAFELGSKKDLTVVTNSLDIPVALSRQAVRDIVVLDGEYRAESHITVGSVTFCGAIPVSGDPGVLAMHDGRRPLRVVGLYPDLEESSLGAQATWELGARPISAEKGLRYRPDGLGMNRLAALDGSGKRFCSCLPGRVSNNVAEALRESDSAIHTT